jgi:hypothetical protein
MPSQVNTELQNNTALMKIGEFQNLKFSSLVELNGLKLLVRQAPTNLTGTQK